METFVITMGILLVVGVIDNLYDLTSGHQYPVRFTRDQVVVRVFFRVLLIVWCSLVIWG